MGKRYVQISFELLVDMLRQGSKHSYEVIEGLPEDAKIFSLRHGYSNKLDILVFSSQWEDKEDEPTGRIDVTFKAFKKLKTHKIRIGSASLDSYEEKILNTREEKD